MITGIAEPTSLGCVRAFDFISANISTIESWEKDPDCKVCGAL